MLPLEFPMDAYADGVTRRGFLGAAALAACGSALAACGMDGGGTGIGVNLPSGVTANGATTQINLATQAALATTGAYLIITNASRSLIVINLGGNSYRALSAVCTHQGCLVAGIANANIVCNCHGSRYTTAGAVVNGPASAPLAQFAAVYDGATNTVTVSA